MANDSVNDQIRAYRQDIELGVATSSLMTTQSFKLVIETNLFNLRLQELVSKLAELTKDSPDFVEVIRELDAISYLKRYLHLLIQKGADAPQGIVEATPYLYDEE